MKKGIKYKVLTDLGDTRPWIGIGLMLISGLGFSSSIIFASMVIKRGVAVNTSNAVRYLVATVLLFVYHRFSR
jgi:hypothetical protein